MSYYGKGERGRATELHSKIVRRRYGACLICGERRADQLQACHILGRSASWTRTWSPNLLCMCASCHARSTDDPVLFARWIRQIREHQTGVPDRVHEFMSGLRNRRARSAKMDWERERRALEAEAWLLDRDWAVDVIRKVSSAEFLTIGDRRVASVRDYEEVGRRNPQTDRSEILWITGWGDTNPIPLGACAEEF